MSVVLVETQNGVGVVTLNRPEKRNAISAELRAELAAAMSALADDAAIRVAILTGSGPAFCAGVDLKQQARYQHPLSPGNVRVSQPLDDFPKPLIAAINGPAFGGGLELALAADIRLACTAARIGLPEVAIGSLPGSGGTQRLAAAVGSSAAARMLFTGKPIDATEALRLGLVSEVTSADELLDAAHRIAAEIAANAPLSLIAAKLALRGGDDLSLERALWGLLSLSEDRAEGRAAFREKRPANFKGA
jgi:E-phenylitaconyl-CoA hydratase